MLFPAAEINLEELSLAAIHFGTTGTLTDCKTVKRHVTSGSVEPALQAAALLVRKRAQERLDQFQVDLQKDEEMLEMLGNCENASREQMDDSLLGKTLVVKEFCKVGVMRTIQERRLLTKFRLKKKELLREVVETLFWPCDEHRAT